MTEKRICDCNQGRLPCRCKDPVPSPTCRQRLAADGKAYPKSNCAVCGQFSPRWRECDAEILAEAQQE